MISREFIIKDLFPILNEITQEYACEWCESRLPDEAVDTLYIRFSDVNNDWCLKHVFNLRRFEMEANPYRSFTEEIRQVLDGWSREKRNNEYRDILVNQIKSAGQQLIDRAEEMISENLSYITGFSINIDIPQPSDEPVSISWTVETIGTNELKK